MGYNVDGLLPLFGIRPVAMYKTASLSHVTLDTTLASIVKSKIHASEKRAMALSPFSNLYILILAIQQTRRH